MQTPEDRPIYRLLTGKDDRAFCERVSEALAQGWHVGLYTGVEAFESAAQIVQPGLACRCAQQSRFKPNQAMAPLVYCSSKPNPASSSIRLLASDSRSATQ